MTRRMFVVTDAMREQVGSLAAQGVPQETIALLECDSKTLRKDFRKELDRGMAEANAQMDDVETLVLNTARQDGTPVHIAFGQDPGQAGNSQALPLTGALGGFTVNAALESGNKITRFGPFSSQCRAGNVKILRARWNEELFRVLEGFPDLAHDDEVDACSGALEMLNR
jgi:predicted phage terminase large subunit-like protein